MKSFLKILLLLIYISLCITNQRTFSLLADNLIPVRILLLVFVFFAAIYFIWLEKSNFVVTIARIAREDKVLDLMILLFFWRALSITQASDLKFSLLMVGWWGSLTWLYVFGSYLIDNPKPKLDGAKDTAEKVRGFQKITRKFADFGHAFAHGNLGFTKTALLGLLLGVFVSVVVAIYQTVAFLGWGVQRFDLWGWQYPDGFRVPGLMLDTNHFGIFMVGGFFAAAGFFIARKNYLGAVLSAFFILGSYSLSSSRSALLGLLAGSLFLVITLVVRREFKTLLVFLIVLPIGFSSVTVVSKAIEVYTTKYVNKSIVLHNEIINNLNNASSTGGINQPPVGTPGGTLEETPPQSELFSVNAESVEFQGALSSLNALLPQRIRRVVDASAKSHLELINASWNLGLRFPILGVGFGNFAEGLRSQPDLYNAARQFDPRGLSTQNFPAHTLWGEQLAETGFVGLALYTLLVLVILVRILNNKSLAGAFFGAAWVAFLAFSVFYSANEEFFWLIPFLGMWLKKYEG